MKGPFLGLRSPMPKQKMKKQTQGTKPRQNHKYQEIERSDDGMGSFMVVMAFELRTK